MKNFVVILMNEDREIEPTVLLMQGKTSEDIFKKIVKDYLCYDPDDNEDGYEIQDFLYDNPVLIGEFKKDFDKVVENISFDMFSDLDDL